MALYRTDERAGDVEARQASYGPCRPLTLTLSGGAWHVAPLEEGSVVGMGAWAGPGTQMGGAVVPRDGTGREERREGGGGG